MPGSRDLADLLARPATLIIDREQLEEGVAKRNVPVASDGIRNEKLCSIRMPADSVLDHDWNRRSSRGIEKWLLPYRSSETSHAAVKGRRVEGYVGGGLPAIAEFERLDALGPQIGVARLDDERALPRFVRKCAHDR